LFGVWGLGFGVWGLGLGLGLNFNPKKEKGKVVTGDITTKGSFK
jgi:hypothetical protein